jgi:hypothetical protein
MAGSNAFAFTGTAFVPSDRTSTASISARTSPSELKAVARAYKITAGSAATQIWVGFPPVPTAPTYRNTRTGTFPNLNNSIQVDWTCETSTLIASFSIFKSVNGAEYVLAATVTGEVRTFNYGAITAGSTHAFYVRANGVSGLNTESTASSTSLAAPSTVGTLSSSKTTTSATASWTVPAGTYQRFHVYAGATYLGEVAATETGTSYSFTRSSLAQNTAYNIRVYGQNYNQHWSTYTEVDITTNTLPIPSISWSDSSATKYSDWSITWTGTDGITYQPQYHLTSWLNNGATQSGSGSKTSGTQTVGYASNLHMRLYVTDAHGATGYTSEIYVTAGRPLIQSTSTAGWGGDSTTGTYTQTLTTPSAAYGNGSSGATITHWGDSSGIQVNSAAGGTDRKVTSVKIVASKVSGYSGSLTSDTRRLVVGLNGSTAREESFNGTSATETLTTGHTLGYASGDRTAYYGMRDAVSYWNTGGSWRYTSSTGSNNFWPGERTRFVMTVSYTERYWQPAVTTTTQTQVNSTYA